MPTADHIAIVLEQLARGPRLVRQVIDEVPPELRKRRPAPGVWSAHEHAVHLPAVQPLFMRRLAQLLRDPSQPIRSYEPSRGANATTGMRSSIRAMGPCFISPAAYPSAWM